MGEKRGAWLWEVNHSLPKFGTPSKPLYAATSGINSLMSPNESQSMAKLPIDFDKMGEIMGGVGSGRPSGYVTAGLTSNHVFIDIRLWKRKGLLIPGQIFKWQWTLTSGALSSIDVHTRTSHVLLVYSSLFPDGRTENHRQSVYLEWSKCHLGGRRPWFLCPTPGCERRVAILYGAGSKFACRQCYNLSYSSQREREMDRAIRRAERIRERLGWKPGILNPPGWQKPRHMHWRTYKQLIHEHDDFKRIACAYSDNQNKKLLRRYACINE